MRTVEIQGLGEPTAERKAAAAAVQAQREYVDQVLAPEPSIQVVPHDLDAGHSVEEEMEVRRREEPLAKRTVQKVEKVELSFVPDEASNGVPAFKLTFNVSDICIRENYISMLITDDMGFQPSATMKFDLKFRGQLKPVIFMGAEFEFQSLGVRGISFLVDSKRQQRYDQNRQSGTR